jgi:hypothetical protein
MAKDLEISEPCLHRWPKLADIEEDSRRVSRSPNGWSCANCDSGTTAGSGERHTAPRGGVLRPPRGPRSHSSVPTNCSCASSSAGRQAEVRPQPRKPRGTDPATPWSLTPRPHSGQGPAVEGRARRGMVQSAGVVRARPSAPVLVLGSGSPGSDSSLPRGRKIASQFSRHERVGCLVKRTGIAGGFSSQPSEPAIRLVGRQPTPDADE